MRNLQQEENGEYTAMAGSEIKSTIAEAINLSAEEEDAVVTFEFNGVMISIQSDSDPDLVYRDWHRALNGYIDKNVGPHPNPVLTDEEKANDNRIEVENERRRQDHQREYEAQASAKRIRVEAKLVSAPPMEISDENAWQEWKSKNRDPLGVATFAYAERWARLAQLEISNGKTLEEVASATSHEADLEGISGSMYGAAIAVLAHCWIYGEQLRRWHKNNREA